MTSRKEERIIAARKDWGQQLRALCEETRGKKELVDKYATDEMKQWLAMHPAGIHGLCRLYNRKMPLCFSESSVFQEFTKALRAILEHDRRKNYCAILIGSSATGYKGNPKKEPKMYPPPSWDEDSDADIALFMPRLVEKAETNDAQINPEHPAIFTKDGCQLTSIGRRLDKFQEKWEKASGLHVSIKLNTDDAFYPVLCESGIVLVQGEEWDHEAHLDSEEPWSESEWSNMPSRRHRGR